MRRDPILFGVSASAGALLLILCTITLATGVSQQRFEWVAGPGAYAAALVADAGWLRAIVALDDAFVAAYVLTTIVLAERLAAGRWGAVPVLVATVGTFAGALDLLENHDLLSMLHWAEAGEAIPAERILDRSSLSQLKWMLGHVAFVGVGLIWPSRAPLDRLFVASLVVVQLPIGAVTWTLVHPTLLTFAIWARYGCLLSGFAFVAWAARSGGLDADATDAPA